MTMVAVNFAFSGTELIGIAAGETENPQKVVPMAIRTTVARLIIFYRHGANHGGADPDGSGGHREKSVRAGIRKIGIPRAADILTS